MIREYLDIINNMIESWNFAQFRILIKRSNGLVYDNIIFKISFIPLD